MVKDELMEGLKLAVLKGESLEHAMATFYNAGYKKEDIEEAAASSTMPVSPIIPKEQPAPISASQQPAKPLVQPQIIQIASNYATTPPKKPKSSSTIITIMLSIFLILLLAVLAALIMFRSQISNLLSGFWVALFYGFRIIFP